MNYIAVYPNGNPIVKSDIESIYNLPGKYFVFSVGSTFNLNEEDGIIYLNSKRKSEKFKCKDLELLAVEYKNASHAVYRFSIYDKRDNTLNKLDSILKNIEHALSQLVTSMLSASKLPDWNTFVDLSKISQYKSQIERLSSEISTLKNNNEVLTVKIVNLEKSK